MCRARPKLAYLATLLIALACSGSAQAAPLDLSCAPSQGLQQCSGRVPSWDGVPLDVTVTLPNGASKGLPLIADIHGFGNSKWEYLDPESEAYTGNAYTWARAGYAVLTYTARGLWDSCGTPEARIAGGDACRKGWIHLADVRFEVRDTQELIGRLVDDGTADPRRIGVTGDSYGGGQSLMLAALRNRVMQPATLAASGGGGTGGSLEPWRSPKGTPLSISAAAPVIPWSDLLYAIAPNGRTLTYAIAAQDAAYNPVGVFKTSFMNGIAAAAQFAIGPGQPVDEPFVQGRPMGYLAPPGMDPDADVLGWVARADRGEPYDDADAQALVRRIERFHAAFHIDSSVPPPPLFIGAGFTDDLFPIDESLRFVERMRRDHPTVPWQLLLGDFGHQRASNKPADRKLLLDSIRAWMDYWLLGKGAKPASGVTATTQTCPRDVPSEGPYKAGTFAGLAKGEVRFDAPAAQTIASTGGDPRVAAAIDPAAGGGDGCVATGTGASPGTAVYSLPRSSGYTLLGAPTVLARLAITGSAAQIAARLWDVAPDGASQRLVARGTFRPTGSGEAVFQLHANGWRFGPGHVPKLELLGSDAPFTRFSNGVFSISVDALQLRLPVRDAPGGQVQAALAPVIPAGQQAVLGEKTSKAKKRAKAKRKKPKRRKRATGRAQPRFTG